MIASDQCKDLKVLELNPKTGPDCEGLFFELRLEHPGWKTWRPGQFVMIRPVSWGFEPMWARPLSICDVEDDCLVLFFQIAGRGTKQLAELKSGDTVTVWGPLGNGFSVAPDTPTLLLAGGIGIAPFLGYVNRRNQPENTKLFMAHRPPLECYPYDDIAKKAEVEAYQEKNSDDLPKIINRISELVKDYADGGAVLCCGPTPFMRTVQQEAIKYGTKAYLSLENRMACGVGACLGCVCEDGEGHNVQTCTRGPVFPATDVKL
ncbi:MAG: dihydroorotate dehydrogenase electron transfer subunit [Desulfovibrio sp.]